MQRHFTSLINNKPPLSWATVSVFETGFIISLFSSLKWQRTCSVQDTKRLAFEIKKDSHVSHVSDFLYSVWVELLCLSRFLSHLLYSYLHL